MIFETRKRDQLTVMLLPMIDIEYIIITFLLVFAVFRGSEAAIRLSLPKATTIDRPAPTPLTISVDRTGLLYGESGPISPAQLKASLRSGLSRQPGQTVVIKADERVEYKYLVQAMDAVREVGGWRIALAVERAPR